MDVNYAIECIRPSIVHIGFHASGLSDNLCKRLGRSFIISPLGTGFLVNSNGYAITALHVIEGAYQFTNQVEADKKQTFIELAHPNTERMRANFVGVDFDVVDEDREHDLVLLKLKRNPFTGEVGPAIGGVPLLFGAARLNPDRPKDGAAIAISGYPLSEAVLVTNVGWMATSWSFRTEEVANSGGPNRFRQPEIADVYLADVVANPGNSGGPVYLIENAVVIGVCVASKVAPVRDQNEEAVSINGRQLFHSSGLTMVIPTRYVVELLNKHNINWSS